MNFIEIGCNDYDTVLHSSFFSASSWGIVAEPIQKFLDNVPRSPHVKYIDAAITANHDGEADFFAPIDNPEPWWIKSMGSLYDDHPTMKDLGLTNQTVKTKVKTMSLDTFYTHIPTDCIHFLKIDTEGTDFDLLMAWDFQWFKPLHIQFESKLMQSDQLESIKDKLKSLGYVVTKGNSVDYNQVPYNHIAVLEL